MSRRASRKCLRNDKFFQGNHFLLLSRAAAASSAARSSALLACKPVNRSNLAQWSPTTLMVPCSASFLMRARATEPLILNFSMSAERVITRILGISWLTLAKRFSSRKTSLLSLSLILTLVQVFFFALPPLPVPAFFAACALLAADLPTSFELCYAFA